MVIFSVSELVISVLYFLIGSKYYSSTSFLVFLIFDVGCYCHCEALDCSPTNKERQPGLDLNETGLFYTNKSFVDTIVILFSTMRDFNTIAGIVSMPYRNQVIKAFLYKDKAKSVRI